ncbi:MAG: MFS transporter [Planctomycetes bacterium]|nr:MFS transporter [Planctomycetota bacterium]
MKRSPLAVLFLVVFIDLVGFGIVLPLLPRYARDYHATGFEQGMLMASFSAMQFLFAPVWGRLSDRIGRRPVLMIGLFGSILAYSMFAVSDSYSMLLVSRIAAGLFGATIGTAQAYIADVTPENERGKGMALIGAAFGIGFTVGPAIGGIAGEHHGQLPGWIAAGLSLFALVLAWRVLPEPERHAARREGGGLFGFGGLRHVIATPTLPLIVGLQVFATLVFATFESTLSLLTKVRFDYSVRENGYLFTFVGVCLVIAQGAVVRRMMPRVGELNFCVMGTGLLAAGLVVLAGAMSLAVVLGGLTLIVFGFAMITPSLSSLLSRRSPREIQGEVLGINQSGLSLARIAGPLAGNWLFDRGTHLPAAVGAGLMALCFLAAGALRRSPWTPSATEPSAASTPPV